MGHFFSPDLFLFYIYRVSYLSVSGSDITEVGAKGGGWGQCQGIRNRRTAVTWRITAILSGCRRPPNSAPIINNRWRPPATSSG